MRGMPKSSRNKQAVDQHDYCRDCLSWQTRYPDYPFVIVRSSIMIKRSKLGSNSINSWVISSWRIPFSVELQELRKQYKSFVLSNPIVYRKDQRKRIQPSE